MPLRQKFGVGLGLIYILKETRKTSGKMSKQKSGGNWGLEVLLRWRTIMNGEDMS